MKCPKCGAEAFEAVVGDYWHCEAEDCTQKPFTEHQQSEIDRLKAKLKISTEALEDIHNGEYCSKCDKAWKDGEKYLFYDEYGLKHDCATVISEEALKKLEGKK